MFWRQLFLGSQRLCAGCQRPAMGWLCLDCESTVQPAAPGEFWAAWRYSGAIARSMIQWKERHRQASGSELVRAAAPQLAQRFVGIDVVVPIPPAFWRTLHRGFHPPDAFGIAAAKALGCAFFPRALVRIDGARQMGRNQSERRKRELFALRKADSLTAKTVLIVDDVTTSGATFRDALRVLGEAKPEAVYCAALAAARTH